MNRNLKPKGHLTPAGRKKISEALKQRWAAKRAAANHVERIDVMPTLEVKTLDVVQPRSAPILTITHAGKSIRAADFNGAIIVIGEETITRYNSFSEALSAAEGPFLEERFVAPAEPSVRPQRANAHSH